MINQIAVGRFGKPFAVHGWIKVISYTDPIENILSYSPWHIVQGSRCITIAKINGKLQGKHLVVKLDQCDSPEAAKLYTNCEIFIARDQLPLIDSDEYYWVDLIGLAVLNQAGESLGTVDRLFPTGSNDVLVTIDQRGIEHFIPYIDSAIVEVRLQDKKLILDWEV